MEEAGGAVMLGRTVVPPGERFSRERQLLPARWAILAAALLLLASTAWLLVRLWAPTDGAPALIGAGLSKGITIDPQPGAGSGLAPDDVVVAVDDVPIDRWLGKDAPSRPRLKAGTQLDYRVLRDGSLVDVAVPLSRAGLVAERLRSRGPLLGVASALFLLGAYTVIRRPAEPAARALLIFGAGFLTSVVFTELSFEVADVVAAPYLLVAGLAGGIVSTTIFLTGVVHLTLTFPVAPSLMRRRPWLIGALYASALVATGAPVVLYTASGNATLAGLNQLNGMTGVAYGALGVIALLGLARTLVQARRDPSVRRQAALVALGLLTTVVALLIANIAAGDERWPPWLPAVIFLPVLAAVTTAVLRGEFLDIRAVLNRTLVYVALTVVLLCLYAVGVALVAAVVGSAGVAEALPAAGVVAVAFAPVRARLQRGVDRLLYGERGDPATVLRALGHRLEAAGPSGEVLPTIAATIALSLRLPYIGILTGSGDEARLACERGERPAEPEGFPLVYQGRPAGTLLVSPRPGERTLSAVDRTLLGDVARQVATAVSAAGLLTDLTVSRSRLAVAREEERAQLRHDLHDRLGSHLVGLSLHLDSLAGIAGQEPIAGGIRQVQTEAERALVEVRRISRGLRPADLEELGLVAAIEAAATRLTVGDDGQGWRASVDAAVHLPPISADVEAAAYQIAVEALTNAYRHSGGRGAQIRIGVDAGSSVLLVEISDDGVGIDPAAERGVGLRSMEDRASAVGGSLGVRVRPEGGTAVRVQLPLGRT